MNILITGAAGFIGSNLVEYHLSLNHRVYGIDNLSTGRLDNLQKFLAHPQFHFVNADVLTFPALKEWVAKVDQIYHMAAVVGVFEVLQNPERVLIVNINTTHRILEAVLPLKKKPRLMMASTSEVYGPLHPVPLKEDSELIVSEIDSNRTSYSVSKIAGESFVHTYARRYKLPATVLRLFNTIGPRQMGCYGMVVPRFIERALENKPLIVYGTGEQSRAFIDVRDSVVLLDKIASAESLIGETINVGSDHKISIEALAKLVKKLANSTSKIEHMSYQEAYGESFIDCNEREADLTKLRQHIDYQTKWSLAETIESLIQLKRTKKLHDDP